MSSFSRLSALSRFGWSALAMALFGATLSASGAAQATAAAAASSAPAPQILPYTAKLIAGGGKTTTFNVGATCPSGAPNTAIDKYGDGCLATDIAFTSGPRYAIPDANGNVFFTDYTNSLVRRVDATTGVVTLIAGGASSNPTSGSSCGTGGGNSADNIGDGCLGTQVSLGHPVGLAFDKSGNLIFADVSHYNVRKLAATNGFITGPAIITLIDGNVGGSGTAQSTEGYQANSGSNNGSLTNCSLPGAACIVAATQGRLNDPYDVTVDSNGNILIADYYNNAILAVNQTGSLQTVGTISIPDTTVGKVMGAYTGNSPLCVNSTGAAGCKFGTFVDGAAANTSFLDDPWGVSTDATGDIFVANMYSQQVFKVDTAGIAHLYGGNAAGGYWATAPNTTRNTGGGFPFGAPFGITSDLQGNVYVPELSNGFIWRIDAATSPTKTGTPGHSMYVIAGGGAATTVGGPCPNSTALATDTFGDGCNALNAKFGSIGKYGAPTSVGLYGIKIDQYSNLYVGDATTNLVREIATGAQFGIVGANHPTNTLDIHFAAGDNQIAPVTAGGVTTYPSFVLTAGNTNFSLGVPVCTTNNDATTTVPANTINPITSNTTDCLIPVTATPTALGAFTGTLTVTSANGGVGTFPLSGTYAQSPNTRVTVSYAATGVSCTGTTTYSNTTPIALTATVTANGPNPPTASADTVTFFANGTQLGQPVQVANTGSSSSPIYTAALNYTFATTGTYTITAVFSGDSYFHTSTGTAPSTITSSTPSFSLSPVMDGQGNFYQSNNIVAGQTALFSFNVNQNVYAGAISFAVTGLPANSNYTLSSTTVNASGCSTVSVVALSINTQAQKTVGAAGFAGTGSSRSVLMLVALSMAMLGFFTLKRSRRLSHLFLLFAGLLAGGSTLGCSNNANTVLQPATPSGTYTITVTPTGTVGSANPITFTMKVN